MSEIRGVDVILEIQSPSSPSQYVEMELFSELGIQVQNSAEDKTTKGSAQKRQLSTAGAMKSYSVDGNFVADDEALDLLENAANAADPKIVARLSVGEKTWEGTWLVENFSYRGGSSGVATGTVSLQSASDIDYDDGNP